jgi:uncharacterized membrane protein
MNEQAQTSAPPPPKPIRPNLGARLRAYFLAGVLVTAPTFLTFYLAWGFLSFIDDNIRPLIPPQYNPESYLPFSIPGIGVVVLVVGLTMVGALTANYLGRLMVGTGERLLARMPVIRGIYSATKQVFETVLAKKSAAFRQVVLIEYPRIGLWSLGFITGATEGEVQELTEDEVLNVFVPTTPNPTSGYLVFAPRKDIVPLSMSVEEGIKMVISGGIVTPPDRRPSAMRGTRIASHAPHQPERKV